MTRIFDGSGTVRTITGAFCGRGTLCARSKHWEDRTVSATVTIPEGITVVVDDGHHDLVAGTYPVHATTATGQQVPPGDRPHFLEVDLPTAGTTGIGVIVVRIPAYEDVFPVETTRGTVRFTIDVGRAAREG